MPVLRMPARVEGYHECVHVRRTRRCDDRGVTAGRLTCQGDPHRWVDKLRLPVFTVKRGNRTGATPGALELRAVAKNFNRHG